MPKIRGIRFERVFLCAKSDFAYRQPEVTREDGFVIAKRFSTQEKTHGDDITTTSASVFMTKQTASSITTATFTQYNTSAVATAWAANDILAVSCFAY